MMAEIRANSVHGKPFAKGYDPRRLVQLPNNKGKKYETRKKLLRRYLELSAGEYNGEPINQLERLVIRRIQAALGERTMNINGEPMTVPIDQKEERLSAQYILDSLFGKPVQPTNTKHFGSIQHNLTGRTLTQLTTEELRAVAEHPERYLKAPDGTIIEAEYTENPVPEIGDSEA